MGLFRASLGVTWTACNVQGDFSSDVEPEKDIAHKIILDPANQREFTAGIETHETGDRVSCYTFHNGASHSKTVPVVKPATACPAPSPPPPHAQKLVDTGLREPSEFCVKRTVRHRAERINTLLNERVRLQCYYRRSPRRLTTPGYRQEDFGGARC